MYTCAMSAESRYLLHTAKAAQLATPLQRTDIYGIASAAIHKIIEVILDAMPGKQRPTSKQKTLSYSLALLVISTETTAMLRYPVSLSAGLILLPTTMFSFVSANLARAHWSNLAEAP